MTHLQCECSHRRAEEEEEEEEKEIQRRSSVCSQQPPALAAENPPIPEGRMAASDAPASVEQGPIQYIRNSTW